MKWTPLIAMGLGLTTFTSVLEAQGGQSYFDAPVKEPLIGPSAPFTVLDSVEGTNVDFVLSSMDGMTLDSSGRLFVVNPYGGKILRFSDPANTAQTQPDLVIDAAVGPVSLDTWLPASGPEQLLCISRSTYALMIFDSNTGALLDSLTLAPEPADLLVVGGIAYVSCSADSQVWAIDLSTRSIVHKYQLTGAIAYSRLFEDAGMIYVTAQHSGNNSLVLRQPLSSPIPKAAEFTFFSPLSNSFSTYPIIDLVSPDPLLFLDGTPLPTPVALPDEDVIGIDPSTMSTWVALKNVGTTLAAGGVNPATNKVWILNMEANNKDPNLQNEPALNGQFISNRISISMLGGVGITTSVDPDNQECDQFLVLDDIEIDNGVNVPQSVGHPYDLCFDQQGNAYVIGLLSDNVVRLTSDGSVDKIWRLDSLADGRIPRDLVLLEAANLLLVYCWGTNDVAVIDLAIEELMSSSLALGYDPTSPERKLGRALFYDAHNSLLNNASCASCHIEGGQDFVAWDLSNAPEDDKGPMQTQNLRGIKPLNPYHWRGERATLQDFNGAFAGLLGGTELGQSDFDAFAAFVFGMQEPANPRTNIRRIVVDKELSTKQNFNIDPVGSTADAESPNLSAVNGQALYFLNDSVGNNTCQECHALPTGTTNDFFHDDLADQDHRSSFDVPAYNGLWRKEQRRKGINVNIALQNNRPVLGVGATHAGNFPSVYDFIVDTFPVLDSPPADPMFPLGGRQDVALFMHQIDSGIAPMAHQSALLDQNHAAAVPFVQFLIGQANSQNIDLACFGTVTIGGVLTPMRWFFNRNLAQFVAEDSGLANRGVQYFIFQASIGNASNMFVGLPRGMGKRWSIDYDDDGLKNLDELLYGTSPHIADHDSDGYLDGVEVLNGSDPYVLGSLPLDDQTAPIFKRAEHMYHTAKVAKYIVESNEHATLRVDYQINGAWAPGSPLLFNDLGKHFSVFLRDLVPSHATTSTLTTAQAFFTLEDSWGNKKLERGQVFNPLSFITATEEILGPNLPIVETILGNLEFASQSTSGPKKLSFNARVLHQKELDAQGLNIPLENQVVVARLLTKAPGARVFSPAPMGSFAIEVGSTSMAAPTYVVSPVAGIPFPSGIDGSAFPNSVVYPSSGPFAVSTPTDSNGDCSLVVIVDSAVLPIGTEFYLCVETAGGVIPASYLAVPDFVEIRQFDAPTATTTSSAFHFPATAPEHRISTVATIQ